jgi:hypothetical protein
MGGCVVVLAGCGGGGDRPAPSVTWHESSLPAPTGVRALVRDASYCGGRWYVVGATANRSGETRPAVWSSPDATRWQRVRLDPGSDVFAVRDLLGSVGCSRGRIAVVGARAGGPRGTLRTTTWRQRADGSLVAWRAPLVLFGGVRAVKVGRLEGGPHGFLIAGTRTSGAAVWRSPDAQAFRIDEGAPGLASTARSASQGSDSVWHDGTWWVIGTATDDAGYVSGMAWTPAAGGSWTRHPVPGGALLATAERAAETPKGLLVVGLDDHAFGARTLSGGSWSKGSTFGRQNPAGLEAAYVSGLAVSGNEVLASYSDGVHFRLAAAAVGGAWGDLAAPESVSVNGDHQVAVAAGAGRFLLLADDGTRGRVWVATAPG